MSMYAIDVRFALVILVVIVCVVIAVKLFSSASNSS